VSDMLNTTARLLFANHRNKRNCACSPCKEDRNQGCTHPHKCTVQGNKYINTLLKKWDPRQIPEYAPPTPSTLADQQQVTTFNANLEYITELSEGFRVFWKKNDRSPRTICDLEDDLHIERRTEHPLITAYTDGSCSRITSNEAKAGCGVWFGDEDERNIALRMPSRLATNNAAELTAVIAAVSQTNPSVDLNIISDSSYVIKGLTKYLKNLEDIGWIDIKNHELFIAAAAALRLRRGKTFFEKVKGHSGIKGNEAADELAAAGARKEDVDEIDTSIPEEIHISGAKLQSMTQALLYTSRL
jgi:ribonuclease HI